MDEPGAEGPIVAVIPARGGSKRIPRKNVRPFLGVPLLARTIRILRDASVFDRIVVSTDDDSIAQLAREAGADVPFMRPAHLADDHTATRPVIQHAIQHIERDAGEALGPVCCVYPAAVFLDSPIIVAGLQLLRRGDADKVMTAAAFAAPIQRAYRRTEAGYAEMIWPENAQARSQDLEETYHDAGQLYWAWREVWLGDVPTPKIQLLELDRRQVQDIDTEQDWAAAELAYRVLVRQRQG